MLKKPLLFIGFFLFFVGNLALISFFYSLTSQKEKQIDILSQLEKLEYDQSQFALSSSPQVLGAVESEVVVADARSVTLRNFFSKHDSPLYDHADFIVSTADKYGLDYRLLPAIAMQESNLCKKIPEDSHNCWGWGITGSKTTRFTSYEEAIETVTKGLKLKYVDKGLTTASEVMKKYAPASDGSWSYSVNHFMKSLE